MARTQSRLRPRDLPNPSPEALGLYFLLRAQGVQIWRNGTSLAVAFPRDEACQFLTPEAELTTAIETNWVGLFEVVCAIEARHRVVFAWLAPISVDRANPYFQNTLIYEPADLLRRLVDPDRATPAD